MKGDYGKFKRLWNPRLTDKQKVLLAYLKEHPGDMHEAMIHAGYVKPGQRWQTQACNVLRNKTILAELEGSKEGAKEKMEKYRCIAIERLIKLMDTVDSPTAVLKAAEAILDRTGLSRDQMKQPEKESSDDAFDASLVEALKKAKLGATAAPEKLIATSPAN